MRRLRFNMGKKTIFAKVNKQLFSNDCKVTFYVCDNRKISTTPMASYDFWYTLYEDLYIRSCKTLSFKGTSQEIQTKIREYIKAGS